MKLTENNLAVIFYLLAALATLGYWYIILFVGNPPNVKPIDNFLHLLNEPRNQLIFWWLLVSPSLCILLAAAYFSKWSQTRMGAFSLFGAGAVLTFASWWFYRSAEAIFVSLALWSGFLILRPHLTRLSRGTR